MSRKVPAHLKRVVEYLSAADKHPAALRYDDRQSRQVQYRAASLAALALPRLPPSQYPQVRDASTVLENRPHAFSPFCLFCAHLVDNCRKAFAT